MRSRPFNAAGAAVLGLIAGTLLGASTPVVAETLDFAPLVVELCVNHDPDCLQSILWQAPDGEIYADAATLEALRLQLAAAKVGGAYGELYRLSALPGAVYSFDAAAQKIELTVHPQAFYGFQTRIGQAETVPLSTGRGAYLDYDLTAGYGDSFFSSGLFNLGTHFGSASLRTSFLAETLAGESSAGRLETQFVLDDPEDMRRIIIGDAISESAPWGNALRFGGIQVGRNFGTQPWLITSPLLSARGSAVVPSTVDVLLNGRPVASSPVPPGPFEFDDLPVISGAGELTIVTRDALGREQVVSQPFYSSSLLLAPGLSDYSFSIGSIRQDFGLEPNSYSGFLASASWRQGITDAWTVEGHGEYVAGFNSTFGLESRLRISSFGVLSLTAAASRSDAGSGSLYGMGLTRQAKALSFSLEGYRRSIDFVTAADIEGRFAPERRVVASIGVRLRDNVSISLVGAEDRYATDRSKSLTTTLSWSTTFGQLSLTANELITDHRDRGVYLSFTWAFGSRSTLSLSGLSSKQGAMRSSRASVTFRRAVPADQGFGFGLQANTDNLYEAEGMWRHAYGTLSADLTQSFGASRHYLRAAGSVVAFGGVVKPTRRIDQSYALVDAGGLADVEVFLENQPVGVTDKAGYLLIGGLRPYEVNHISFDSARLPLDILVSSEKIKVRPAAHAGVLVPLPISKLRTVSFRLKQPDGSWVPVGAQVLVEGRSGLVGYEGLIYIEAEDRLVQGEAKWGSGTCRFTLEVAPSAGVARELEETACE